MQTVRHRATVTTDGSGNASAPLTGITGVVMQIRYIPGGTPLEAGTNLTITETVTGLEVLTMAAIGTSAFTRAPRLAVALNTSGAVGAILDYIAVAGDLTITIDTGGAVTSGEFFVYLGR